MIRTVLAGCLAVAASACSMYKPLAIDAKTGMYPTTVKVDPGGVQSFDTSIDPRGYKVVLLLTDSNMRPSVFSFAVRSALAQAGITRVYSGPEFMQLARDRGLSTPGDGQTNVALIQRYSNEVAPVLLVSYTYAFVGNARFHSRLAVFDAKSERALLRVDHPRHNWVDADTEALYPVLNELRHWVDSSAKGKA